MALLRRLAAATLLCPRVPRTCTAPSAVAVGADDRRKASTWANTAASIAAAGATATAVTAAAFTVASTAAAATVASTAPAAVNPLAAGLTWLPPRLDRFLLEGVAADKYMSDLIAKLDEEFAKLGFIPAGFTTQTLAQVVEPYIIVCLAAFRDSVQAEVQKQKKTKKKKVITYIGNRVRLFADCLRVISAFVTVCTVVYFYLYPIKARARVDALIQALVNSAWYHASWGIKGETLEARYLRIQDERRKALEEKKVAEAQRQQRMEEERWVRMIEERRRVAARRFTSSERLKFGFGVLTRGRAVRAGNHMLDHSNYKGSSTGVKEWLLACHRQY